jgi:hypothetical protein
MNYEDIKNMSGLLHRNKKLFIEYALRDSHITVMRAVETEMFNRSVKQIGISLTLSFIGINYVANE